MYQQAVTRLIRAADQVADYRADLAAFADTLAGKKWGAEVTGPIQDMDSRLAAIEGTYRDLAAQMRHQGGQGASAYDQAPWVPGPEAVTDSYAVSAMGNKHFPEVNGRQEDSFMPDTEAKGEDQPDNRIAEVATRLPAAASRKEAAELLNGLTQKELAQVAKMLGKEIHGRRKADQLRNLVDHVVGARLDHEAIQNYPGKTRPFPGRDPMPDNETEGYRQPSLADVRRGGRFGQHVLPDRADDMLVERLVRVVFKPQPMFPGLPCKDPEDPVLVQQLLDHAPRTDRTGVDDWDRPLRADEVAEIYGTPMEGDPLDVRIAWLRRADELCRAWGKPLAGPGGLVPDMTLPGKGKS